MLARLVMDRGGNLAVVFALCSLPLVAAAGLALDYHAASTQRSQMRNAADGAALALATAGNGLSQSQAKAMAMEFVRANYPMPFDQLSVSRSGRTWNVSMAGQSQTWFADMLGLREPSLGVSSSASFAFSSYEIGLVFDVNSGMQGEKLDALKRAAARFVDALAGDAGAPGSLEFALVPFSNFVNVGPEHGPRFDNKGKLIDKGAEWLDTRGKNPIPQSELDVGLSRFELFHHLGEDWEGCVETRVPRKSRAYDVTDLPGEKRDKHSLFVPAFSIDEPDVKKRGTVLFANSYLSDAGTNLNDSKKRRLEKKYAVRVEGGGGDDDDDDDGLIGGIFGGLSDALFGVAPAVDKSISDFWADYRERKGPNFDCAAQPLLPLTGDYAEVKRRLRDLEANGSTNMLEGMMWGWRVLSPDAPFDGGKPRDTPGNEKIVIFLSDGRNDWKLLDNDFGSSYSSFGYIADGRLVEAGMPQVGVAETMDDKTLTGCTNAKKDGVTIFTIRLERDDAATAKLLKACASSDAHYLNVENANGLSAAFETIRSRLRRIHISS